MYYYLRVIAAMFMEREAVPAVAAATVAPAPVPGKRVSTKLSNARAGAATAVAVKTGTSPLNQRRTAGAVEKVEEKKVEVAWTTWAALGIAALGTFAMGTVLPFWLVNVAVNAAGMMR